MKKIYFVELGNECMKIYEKAEVFGMKAIALFFVI